MAAFAQAHLVGLIWVAVALGLGGILKGATGAGAPVIAVPVIALYFDVPTAVAVMVLPNFATNLIQSWKFRAHLPAGRFPWLFAGGGFVGAWIGTVMLAHVAPQILLMMVAAVVFLYIGFRLARPDWALSRAVADRVVFPTATVAGVLQGATGVSAPVSITFLNAMRPERAVFVATISLFFLAMTLVQIPAMTWYGLLTPSRALGSAAALVPIVAAMPLGAALAKRLPKEVFDKTILVMLACVAAKLVWDASLH
ncbi:sulfite exporter TauE/SafE family protein [Sagittula salina]|uniref:Probable membrane transporter protein n=1 Tax=Sagittula salina TaxID=2820268 RepID=A0A940MRU1_9RHOB|nr:sulfite exporter TauE/SafE family protein [Sagittula salina]MBP0482877.1 sulfite exporter TauE/SafE family protein [Sagittula salina]